jgi:hypothetical protein
MNKDMQIPDGLELDKPSVARIYDYILGGYHNFEIDRLMGEKLLEIYPDSRLVAQALRACLRRMVSFLVEQGIDQFLDIGSGIPTVGNVHSVVQQVNPAAHVVYVDIDCVAVAHSTAMLKDDPNATAICADAHYPDRILNHAEVKRLLDFSRPAAVLFLGMLQYIVDDDQAHNTVRTFRDALVPGSYIAISHGTRDSAPREQTEQVEKLSTSTPTPSKYRTRAEIQQLFEGFELVEPRLVYIPLWRPEGPDDIFLDQPERSMIWGGVGRKAA